LTKEQTEFVIKRINDDRGDALPDEINLSKVLHHMKDWTIWAYGCIFMLVAMPNYAQSYFVPIILQGMGYDRKGTLVRVSGLRSQEMSELYAHRTIFTSLPCHTYQL
jgi:hypothetical protein